jgi:cellulase (glycosyl hydrolase family 5)
MSDSHPNEAPEFANTDHATRRRELAAAGTKAHEHLDQLKKRLNLPGLVNVKTEAQPLARIPNPCIERFIVRRLLTGPNQGLLKEVFEQWSDGDSCYSTTYTFGIQFTGYGAYCMSFEKDPTNSNLFGNFFRDVSNYGVNLHRTMLFVKESWENQTPNNTHMLLEGSATNATVRSAYLTNLNRLVSEAKSRGIVVEVCLFVHHAVVASNNANMPLPVVLSGTPHDRYRAFCNTGSTFLQTQKNFIDAVANQLRSHWNVVYEVGNEMRVPNPVGAYNDSHLKAWIDWVADRVRGTGAGQLITTSTGAENEALINTSQRIQFCSFHQGQWVGKMDTACDNAKNYGNKHVIFDDDGSARPLTSVKAWSKAALNVRGGCKVSYNHKGFAPTNAYNAQWINTPPPAGQENTGKPIDALTALRDARNTSTSPCAHNN